MSFILSSVNNTQQTHSNPDLNLDQGFLMSKIGGGMSDQKTAVVEIKHIATFGWFFIIFSMLLSVLFISV